jgi:predicted DNA-binding transcriptional regulator YafY
MFKLGGVADTSSTITANLPQLELLPLAKVAIAARARCGSRYHAAARTLQPYALLLREGFWYVIGHDVGHDEVAHVRVDRIEGPSSRESPASSNGPRTSIHARCSLRPEGARRRRADRGRAHRPHAVDVRVSELGDERVVRRHDDGAVEVEVPCSNLDAFRSWLFGWGAHAEVVGPPAVRGEIVDWLREMASRS